jgi:hypothetical protein
MNYQSSGVIIQGCSTLQVLYGLLGLWSTLLMAVETKISIMWLDILKVKRYGWAGWILVGGGE